MNSLLRIGAAAALVCALAAGFNLSAPAQTEPAAPVVQTVPTQTPQTQITTTAPVSSETTISVGTLGGQVLMWIAAAFSIPIGAILTLWLKRLMTLAGVQGAELMSAKLQSIIVNGLNAGAANVSERLKGRGQVEIKNAVVADAVKYTQAHAAETIQALGLDPKSGEAVQAIKARIETAIADPGTPTPIVITPASQAKV
jgi:hypothetical protein